MKLFYIKRKDESYGSYYVVLAESKEQAIELYYAQHHDSQKDNMDQYDVEEIPEKQMIRFEIC